MIKGFDEYLDRLWEEHTKDLEQEEMEREKKEQIVEDEFEETKNLD